MYRFQYYYGHPSQVLRLLTSDVIIRFDWGQSDRSGCEYNVCKATRWGSLRADDLFIVQIDSHECVHFG